MSKIERFAVVLDAPAGTDVHLLFRHIEKQMPEEIRLISVEVTGMTVTTGARDLAASSPAAPADRS